MRRPGNLLRLTVAILAAINWAPLQAMAQPAPPLAAPQQPIGIDPPARVGRLAQLSGAVSFHDQTTATWSPARLNYPLRSGDALWTDANAAAIIEVSSSRMSLAPATELDITTLNDTIFQAVQPQGELYLHLGPEAPDVSFSVQTPRGLVTLQAPGRYAVTAGDTQSPTTIIVVDGAAAVSGPDLSLQVGPSQMASITGTESFAGSVGPAQRDGFLAAMLAREEPARSGEGAVPAEVATMPGGNELSGYGTWETSGDYGPVWYPRVDPDWVPYSDGSWSYVEPWGWSWVDNAAWGFAPFHYGRWTRVGGRWGWAPGERTHPVYAPALVTFFGAGAVAGAGIGAALGSGRVGWLPLGPREAYHPWYRASQNYVRTLNGGRTGGNPGPSMAGFANRNAATVVPMSAFGGTQQVRPIAQRLDPGQVAMARPWQGQPPNRPSGPAPQMRPTPAGPASTTPTAPSLTPAQTAPGAVHTFPSRPALVIPGSRPLPPSAGAISPAMRTPAHGPETLPPPATHAATPQAAPILHAAPQPQPQPQQVPRTPEMRPMQPSAPVSPAIPAGAASHPFVPQPAPVVHPAPPPQPQPQAQPRPAPIFHAAPPPQIQMHPQQPPQQQAQPQQVHAQPAPAPHPQPPPQHQHSKRPGEP